MWLILHERDAVDAVWVARGLGERGIRPLELVTAHDLAGARRWEHRIGVSGTSTAVELRDGRTIESAHVSGALNRLVAVPPDVVASAAPADREYALQELHALFVSWLYALPGQVLNRGSPESLGGPWLSPAEWITLAARAGLVVPTFRRSSSDGVRLDLPHGMRRALLIVGRRALAPAAAPPDVRAGAGRLAQLVPAELLEVRFRVDAADRWVFAGADARPPLRRYGQRALDLVAAALKDSAG